MIHHSEFQNKGMPEGPAPRMTVVTLPANLPPSRIGNSLKMDNDQHQVLKLKFIDFV
jgi:hypothetical protein